MKLNITTSIKSAVAVLAIVAMTCVANGVPVGFTEDFSGGSLDAAWNQGGYAPGHLGLTGAGEYELTTIWQNAPKLQRFDTGDANPLLSYTHEITMNLDTFFLTGSGGTQSDFKWKNFGADGFMEIVLNSFGDMRVYHNNQTEGAGGDLVSNTNIGVSEGDSLSLVQSYNAGTDTMDISYSINAGASTPFFSGTGNGGSIGNVIGNFVEVELYKWGELSPVPLVALDEWNLAVVPEPATLGLLGLGGFGLFLVRRFRI